MSSGSYIKIKDKEKEKDKLKLDLSAIEKQNKNKKGKSMTNEQLADCLSEMDTQRTESNENILGNID